MGKFAACIPLILDESRQPNNLQDAEVVDVVTVVVVTFSGVVTAAVLPVVEAIFSETVVTETVVESSFPGVVVANPLVLDPNVVVYEKIILITQGRH